MKQPDFLRGDTISWKLKVHQKYWNWCGQKWEWSGHRILKLALSQEGINGINYVDTNVVDSEKLR